MTSVFSAFSNASRWSLARQLHNPHRSKITQVSFSDP